MDGTECGGCRKRRCECELTPTEWNELEAVAKGDLVWERAFHRIRAQVQRRTAEVIRYREDRHGGLG